MKHIEHEGDRSTQGAVVGGQLLTDEPKTCLPFSPAARARLPWAAGLGSQLGQKTLANFPVKAFSVPLSV